MIVWNVLYLLLACKDKFMFHRLYFKSKKSILLFMCISYIHAIFVNYES